MKSSAVKHQVLGFTLSYLKTGKEDLLFKTAVLLRNIAVNNPFEYGNIIIAFIAADCQMRINGWFIKTLQGDYLKRLEARSLNDISKTIDANMVNLETEQSFDDALKTSLEFNFDLLRRIE